MDHCFVPANDTFYPSAIEANLLSWRMVSRKAAKEIHRKAAKNKEAIYQIIKTPGHLCVKLFAPLVEKNNLHSKPQRKKTFNISAIEETLYQGKWYLLMKRPSCHLQRTFLGNQKLITRNGETFN